MTPPDPLPLLHRVPHVCKVTGVFIYRSQSHRESVRLHYRRPRPAPSGPSAQSPAWAWSGLHWSLRRDQSERSEPEDPAVEEPTLIRSEPLWLTVFKVQSLIIMLYTFR